VDCGPDIVIVWAERIVSERKKERKEGRKDSVLKERMKERKNSDGP
jgi:ribosomal protein L13